MRRALAGMFRAWRWLFIGDRLRAEREARETEARLRAIIGSLAEVAGGQPDNRAAELWRWNHPTAALPPAPLVLLGEPTRRN